MRSQEFFKKLKIIRNFSKSAPDYDKNSCLQKNLEDIIIKRISGKLKKSKLVLDIGSGTGSFCAKASRINSEASFYGFDMAWGMVEYAVKSVGLGDEPDYHKYSGSSLTQNKFFLQADAEYIPFKENLFDIVVSNSVYQWVGDLKKAFGEARRVLKNRGEFHFVFFGGNTLIELKKSFDMAYKFYGLKPERHTEKFFKIADIDSNLKKSGFRDITLNSFLIEKEFRGVDEMPLFLKKIGAVNANLSDSYGLGRKKVFLKMMDNYRKLYNSESGVKATFEVFLGKVK